MSDYKELENLANDAIVFAGMNGETSCAQELFIAAASPERVLSLIAENKKLHEFLVVLSEYDAQIADEYLGLRNEL